MGHPDTAQRARDEAMAAMAARIIRHAAEHQAVGAATVASYVRIWEAHRRPVPS